MARFAAVLAAAAAFNPIDAAFDQFKAEFNKTYSNDVEERRARAVFETNMKFISEYTAQNTGVQLEINEFSDMTHEEFKASRVCSGTPALRVGKALGTFKATGAQLPESVDWSQKGAVTEVKNQGQCGSCWSFSTTGALEGAWALAGNPLTALSEQEFVDCDQVDQGCNGGLMDNAFKFAESNGICTEESYSYQAVRGECKKSSCTVGIPQGSVVGFHDVDHTEEALMEAVAQQPVSIAIEADQMAFQSYAGGVLQSGCGDQLDHGVLLVGYGTLNGVKYWKVKNSWGPSWGLNGYILIARGVEGQGECGIRADPSFPVVKKAEVVV